jgi:hypothetical protein
MMGGLNWTTLMYRLCVAIAATLVAVVLLTGAAYEASNLASYAIRAAAHVRPAVTMMISMIISLGGAYFAIWMGLRHDSRNQAAPRNTRARYHRL